MYGAIIGDVAGSYIEVLEIECFRKKEKRSFKERVKILDKKTKLFNENCSCTDDSCLTVAIADAILNKKDYEKKLKEYALREMKLGEDLYGRSRFSSGFSKWAKEENDGFSTGNGCIMRIGPVGYLFNDEKTILEEATKATEPSHNTEESITSAQVIARSIYLLKIGTSKEQLKTILKNDYDINLNYNLEELQKNNTFTALAFPTLKLALFCFFESTDFEDAIRKAISIGGDADTLACVVGSLSESYYEIPQELINQVQKYIPDYYKEIINKFYNTLKKD